MAITLKYSYIGQKMLTAKLSEIQSLIKTIAITNQLIIRIFSFCNLIVCFYSVLKTIKDEEKIKQ